MALEPIKNRNLTHIFFWPNLQLKYAKIDSSINGNICKGVIFSTYSSLIRKTNGDGVRAKYNFRLKQLIEWCGGEQFDGVIIFDECHKAKNLVTSGNGKKTITGQAVVDLQKALPNARIVYASATGEYTN